MTSTVTRLSRTQPPGRTEMDDQHRADPASPDGEAPTGLAAQQPDDHGEMPASRAEHHASSYPAQVSSISRHLLTDGYTITWAPAPAGCSLTIDRHGPRGEHDAYRGTGPTMQRAWDQVRAQLGDATPPAASGTGKSSGPAHSSACLYRVVQYYDSWPFRNDSHVPNGSNSRKRTETFRRLAPVKRRLARANGYAQYQRLTGGDWSAFVAIAEQLTDDGWQPIEVDLLEETRRPATPRRETAGLLTEDRKHQLAAPAAGH